MKNIKTIGDSDLISARKAAIAFHEDAQQARSASRYHISKYQRALRHYPIFYLIGVLTGVLGVLIFSSL